MGSSGIEESSHSLIEYFLLSRVRLHGIRMGLELGKFRAHHVDLLHELHHSLFEDLLGFEGASCFN